MNSLSTELKDVIARRLQQASPSEVLAIASTLCAPEISVVTTLDTGARFSSIGSDAVADRDTGLVWARKTLDVGWVTWAKAKETAAAARIGGYEDWRLPTIKELLTLVDYERHEPAIDPIFQCESSWYWTVTPYAPSPGDCAWGVYFGSGLASYYGGASTACS